MRQAIWQGGDDARKLRLSQLARKLSIAINAADPNKAGSELGTKVLRHIDECERALLAKMDANFRRIMFWYGMVFLATIGNIVKDLAR